MLKFSAARRLQHVAVVVALATASAQPALTLLGPAPAPSATPVVKLAPVPAPAGSPATFVAPIFAVPAIEEPAAQGLVPAGLVPAPAAASIPFVPSLPPGALPGGAPPVFPAAPNLPNTGLASSVAARILENSQRLGFVASSLMKVQSQINRADQEFANQVFDFKRASNFYANHEQTKERNREMTEAIAKLRRDIVSLQYHNNQVNKQIAIGKQHHDERMAQMRAKLQQDLIEIDHLKCRLNGTCVAHNTGTTTPLPAASSAAPAAAQPAAAQPANSSQVPAGAAPAPATPSTSQPSPFSSSPAAAPVGVGAPAPVAPAPVAPAPGVSGTTATATTTTVKPCVIVNVTVTNATSVLKELAEAKKKLKQVKATNRLLGKEVIRQHDYGEKCLNKTDELVLRIKDIEKKRDEAKDDLKTTERETQLSMQRLMRGNAFLGQRLQKTHVNSKTAKAQVALTQMEVAALEKEGQVQVAQLTNSLSQEQKDAEALEADLMAKIKSRQGLQNTIKSAQLEVQDLETRLMNGEMARLRMNNSAFKGDLSLAQKHFQESQAALGMYIANLARQRELRDALVNATQASLEKANAIKRESLAQVADAKQTGQEASDKAEAATTEAESSQVIDCNALWDKKHPEVLQELKECEQVPLDLQMANAQVAALSSSVAGS